MADPAAVVRRGSQEPSEILYVAAAAGERGQGYGKQLVAAVVAELPAHGRTLLVDTANCTLDNIAFTRNAGSGCTRSNPTSSPTSNPR